MLYAPGIARDMLAELLDILAEGNIHANRHVGEQRLMDNLPRANGVNALEASDFSDALMDISYLVEKLKAGKNLGEVVRSSSSIVTKNAVLRIGTAELLDAECPIEQISKPEDENHRHLIERAVLNQVILLLDIYEASLKDKDIERLKEIRLGLKKELAAIRARADKGDEKAKAMLADAQNTLDNARLADKDKRFNYGALTAINFLRNRIYARILQSSSTDVAQSDDDDDDRRSDLPAQSYPQH